MACPWSCACDPPPPLIKVASNTRPYSKLGGTTLNGREEGGQYYSLQTCNHEWFEARKVVFRWECLNIFAAGFSTKTVLWSKINLIVSYVSYFKFAARAIKPHFHATCFFGNQSITEIDTVICTAVYHLVKKMTISMHKHALSQLHWLLIYNPLLELLIMCM